MDDVVERAEMKQNPLNDHHDLAICALSVKHRRLRAVLQLVRESLEC